MPPPARHMDRWVLSLAFFAVHGKDFTMCAARPRLLSARHWRVVCGRGVTPLTTFNSFVM